jgi:hypothetical protein
MKFNLDKVEVVCKCKALTEKEKEDVVTFHKVLNLNVMSIESLHNTIEILRQKIIFLESEIITNRYKTHLLEDELKKNLVNNINGFKL